MGPPLLSGCSSGDMHSLVWMALPTRQTPCCCRTSTLLTRRALDQGLHFCRSTGRTSSMESQVRANLSARGCLGMHSMLGQPLSDCVFSLQKVSINRLLCHGRHRGGDVCLADTEAGQVWRPFDLRKVKLDPPCSLCRTSSEPLQS
jgi:hypothetical protein